jgi:hypothetical protein
VPIDRFRLRIVRYCVSSAAVVPAHHHELIEQAIAQLAGLALVGGGPGYRSLTGSEFARALARARAFETVSY